MEKSLKLVTSTFEEVVRKEFDRVYIIIDALDESPDQALASEIAALSSGLGERIRFIVASRNEARLETCFKGRKTLPIEGGDIVPDIECYVRSRLDSPGVLHKLPDDVKVRIRRALVQGAKGM
jgi:hypothetical protein